MPNDFLNSYKNPQAENTTVTPENKADAPVNTDFVKQESKFTAPQNSSAPPLPKKGINKPLVASVTVVVAIATAMYLLFSGGVKVPSFADYTVSDVAVWSEQNGINVQREDVFSDEVPENYIINQSVTAGDKIKKGEFLKLAVSKGHDLSVEVELPDFYDMSKAEVEKFAADNFMTKVRITTEFSETVPSGTVIKFATNDDTVLGDRVRRDTPIYVVISKGVEVQAAEVKVPDFKTLGGVNEALAFGRENDIEIVIDEVHDDLIAAGTLMSQSVVKDKMVARGSKIVLRYSKGKLVMVPNFFALSKEAATIKATELSISVVKKEKYHAKEKDTLISQSVKAGTLYEKGTVIELVYSLGNLIPLKSFVGGSQIDFQQYLIEQNEKGAGLNSGTTQIVSDRPLGNIVSQSPQNGFVPIGTVVYVEVSKGIPVTVPDFCYYLTFDTNGDPLPARPMTIEEAIAECAKVGIVPIFVAQADANPPNGGEQSEIWSQSIPAGRAVLKGDSITLKYIP